MKKLNFNIDNINNEDVSIDKISLDSSNYSYDDFVKILENNSKYAVVISNINEIIDTISLYHPQEIKLIKQYLYNRIYEINDNTIEITDSTLLSKYVSYQIKNCNCEVLDLNYIDVSKCIDLDEIFMNIYINQYSPLKVIDISNWDVSNAKSFHALFHNFHFNGTIKVSGWNTDNVTSFSNLCSYANIYKIEGIENWDTKNVKNFSNCFLNFNSNESSGTWQSFTDFFPPYIDISQWDVSNAQYMVGMLKYTHCIDCDLSQWNVSNVKSFEHMFYQNNIFDNYETLLEWNVKTNANIDLMFYQSNINNDLYEELTNKWHKNEKAK